MQFLLFNIGFGEIGFVLIIVVMFFGSKQIPAIARELGKGIRMMKNATEDIKRSINDSAKLDEEEDSITDTIKEGKKAIDEISGTIKRNLNR
ncbi:MAG: twin-arginine translocase TatA/TatE family subunit [Cryomorphaceae bacterium]|nr:twin-arginine translocase TatA/TatE family subunit [Cryomorphaceae bacterium]